MSMLGKEDVEFMDTSDTPWFWYYLADCGRWHRFEDDPDNPLRSEYVEKYYLINSKGTLSTSSSRFQSSIDFSTMLETNSTGRKRRIQRSFNIKTSCSCFCEAPVFWEHVDPTCPYQLIPLSELTGEYKTVAGYVKNDGLLDRPIISISRIQNLDLWEMFCLKRRQLLRIRGVKDIQERRLFHGTEIKNLDNICKYNFDVRLSGQHGHTYGKGVYFAKHAAFADKYSHYSTDPLPFYGGQAKVSSGVSSKILFLARVMIGTPVVGQSDFKKPDHGKPGNVHDSCVNDIKNPTIHVLFDPNQIYPEYVIQYR